MKTPPPPSSSAHNPTKSPPPPAKKGALLTFSLLVLVLAGGGISWWEHTQIVNLQQQLEVAQSALDKATRTVAEDSVRMPQAPPISQPEEPAAPDPADARARGMAAFGSLLNNPQVQQLADGMARSAVANAYAGLFQQLNLNQEQSDALSSLLAQRALVGGDVLRNAMAQGLDPAANAAQLRQQVSQAQGQVDQSIHTMLGDSGYQQYQAYNSNLSQNQRGAFGGLPGGN